ncbi:MAG: hypothetical protein RBS43_10390, partial [Candidatus Cloacimonas sp.]|nr:hypothetical protein [Candidatus Cloacimonas sp.]
MKAYIKVLIPVVVIIILALAAYNLFLRKNALNGPESIAFDEVGKRFLVSNVHGQVILAMSPQGKHSPFLSKGLKSPRGMVIQGESLYVADGDRIQVVKLST